MMPHVCSSSLGHFLFFFKKKGRSQVLKSPFNPLITNNENHPKTPGETRTWDLSQTLVGASLTRLAHLLLPVVSMSTALLYYNNKQPVTHCTLYAHVISSTAILSNRYIVNTLIDHLMELGCQGAHAK